MFTWFIWSFHLYTSKMIEKTSHNTNCLTRLWLMLTFFFNKLQKLLFYFSEKSGGITFGQSVVPICLPSPKLSSRQFVNVTISGWGKVNYEGFSTAVDRGLDTLQDAQVPIVDSAVCATDKVKKVTKCVKMLKFG